MTTGFAVDARKEWVNVLRALSAEFPSLIFWKHLERGLAGLGDIDSIAPPGQALVICERFAVLASQAWEDVELVFACRHADNVHPVFVVQRDVFPKLYQFDVSYRPVRMGMPWCLPDALVDFSHLNNDGIRVLRPGALAIVLLMLYGIHLRRRPQFKPHDFVDITYGLQQDMRTARSFVNIVLPSGLRSSMQFWLTNGFQSSKENGLFVLADLRSSYWACARAASFFHLRSGLRSVIAARRRRLKNLCEVEKIVHHHDRIVPAGDITDFIVRMKAEERILFDCKSIIQ
jgi:hypothetical protein